jgi:signal peptidase I
MDVMDTSVVDDDDLEDDEDLGRKSYTKELWFLLTVALVLALVMKTFLIQAFFIPSGSMEKTLHGCDGCTGDRVLVNKLVYKFRDIHRGEIVVFNGKGTNFSPETVVPPPKNVVDRIRRDVQGAIGLGGPNDKDFIKRVIGIPGDVVACCDGGRVTVNGEALDEPYVYLSSCPKGYLSCADARQAAFEPVTVPKDQLFLMGDHRDGSSDSRYNGPVPQKAIVGRAFAVFYPLERRKVLRVPGTFQGRNAAAAPGVLGFAMAVPITVVRRRLRRTTD